LLVKRFFFLLNAAFAMAILDLISQVHIRENKKKIIKMAIIQGKLPDHPLLAAIHYKEPVFVEKLIFSQPVKIHLAFCSAQI
jgi:hypothetical protein